VAESDPAEASGTNSGLCTSPACDGDEQAILNERGVLAVRLMRRSRQMSAARGGRARPDSGNSRLRCGRSVSRRPLPDDPT
jgi:hypothetical protein